MQVPKIGLNSQQRYGNVAIAIDDNGNSRPTPERDRERLLTEGLIYDCRLRAEAATKTKRLLPACSHWHQVESSSAARKGHIIIIIIILGTVHSNQRQCRQENNSQLRR